MFQIRKYPWLTGMLVLLGIELICRLFAFVFLPPLLPPLYRYIEDRGWALQPGYNGAEYHAPVRINSLGWRDSERKSTKPDNTTRVVCLGDSRTFGFAVGASATYPQQLERILQKSDGTWEVWNAGVPGYTAFQGSRALRAEILPASPDIVVISFGFNERRYVAKPEWKDSEDYFRSFARGSQFRERIGWFGIGQVMLNAAQAVQRYAIMRHPPLPTELAPRLERHEFLREMAEMVVQCRQKNVPVLFLFLPDNPTLLADLNKGLEAAERGNANQAAIYFLRSLQDFPFGKATLSMIELIRLSEKTGTAYLTEEQKHSYPYSVSTHGADVVRHDRDYRQAAIDLAIEKNVPYLDMTETFTTMPSIYFDQCHFSADGHAAIARKLAEMIPEILPSTVPDVHSNG